MRLSWRDLGTPRADRAAGKTVELTGFPLTVLPTGERRPFPDDGRARLLRRLRAQQSAGRGRGAGRQAAEGWQRPAAAGRHLAGLARSRWLALPATRRRNEAGRHAARVDGREPALLPSGAGDGASADGTAVDIHSHAGNLTRASYGRDALLDVSGPMRKGGLSVICLAIVADSPIIQLSSGRLRPSRDPRPANSTTGARPASPSSTSWRAASRCRSSRRPPTCALPGQPSRR